MPEEKKTKYCTNCGAEIDAKAKICPKCGAEQPLISEKVSSWWYVPSIFLGFVGGLIAWAVNKDRNPKKALRFLIVGIVITIVPIIGIWASIVLVSSPGAARKAQDASIVSAITQARTIMTYIDTVEDSYESFSCAHEDMKEICEEIKQNSPDKSYPVIKQSKEGACIYSKLNAKKDYWYCADSEGRAGFIDSSGAKPAPGDPGFCDGNTFICPPVEED